MRGSECPNRVDTVEKGLSAALFFLALVLRAAVPGAVGLVADALPPMPLRWRHFGWRAEQAKCHGLEVLHDCGEVELITRAGEPAQPHALKAVVCLQVRKMHFDPLPLIA
jgi:hypothetical protein